MADEATPQERANRELIELLNELRVALPGVQVLFAFLLAVPFQQRFHQATSFQRDAYFVTLSAALVSTVADRAIGLLTGAAHRAQVRHLSVDFGDRVLAVGPHPVSLATVVAGSTGQVAAGKHAVGSLTTRRAPTPGAERRS